MIFLRDTIIMEQKKPYSYELDRMIVDQIEHRGIKDERLLEVMRRVPRHLFIPENIRSMAYDDGPLPIGNAQTISQPYIVALMTNLLHLQSHENVLEIGTGSGYQTAILAHLVKTVHTVERIPELAESAKKVLNELNLNNIFIHISDGSVGWKGEAPYQAIIVTAAAPSVPEPLLQQLDDNGRLVIPIGPRLNQDLQVWWRKGSRFEYENVIPVAFVPLRGACGWRENDW